MCPTLAFWFDSRLECAPLSNSGLILQWNVTHTRILASQLHARFPATRAIRMCHILAFLLDSAMECVPLSHYGWILLWDVPHSRILASQLRSRLPATRECSWSPLECAPFSFFYLILHWDIPILAFCFNSPMGCAPFSHSGVPASHVPLRRVCPWIDSPTEMSSSHSGMIL
jgi:hypothetical protein